MYRQAYPERLFPEHFFGMIVSVFGNQRVASSGSLFLSTINVMLSEAKYLCHHHAKLSPAE
jgi:hypothetical protein